MEKACLFFLLFLAVFTVGCISTGSVAERSVEKSPFTEGIKGNSSLGQDLLEAADEPAAVIIDCDDSNLCTTDRLINDECSHTPIECGPSEKLCPDGFIARCSNACTDGECSDCLPDCAGHDADLCKDITCSDSTDTCPDGFTASCENSCSDGECSECIPDCTGHDTEMHVMFSEIMYDPLGTESQEEWIELYNPFYSDISIEGWTISDNSGTWMFPDITIKERSYLVIARDRAGFEALYRCTPDIDTFTRGLNNGGDQLTLKNSNGDEIDFVAWAGGHEDAYPSWDIETDEGQTLQRINNDDTNSKDDWLTGEGTACE